jgi:pyruvate-ferredoxin/flavodoxin oxidoreductase
MPDRRMITVDGNEAAASVAFRLNEVAAIYPITPSSPMGEFADEWSAKRRRNIWGTIPTVQEMQSEAGAAGAVHGALQVGALTTTFTASQGLLLMVPNMYKIAGELTTYVMHVTARTVATHALSIFGDHSDVMACRQTGFGMLSSNSVQEAHDLACVSQAASLESRLPFIHFFDGFRTSHEVNKMEELTDDDLRHMINDEWVQAHRERGLTPDRPCIRGTAQNPDAFFQARESCNPFYLAGPEIVQKAMDRFADLTGRAYHLFDYVGAPDAERVVIMMGSGAETAHETVEHLNRQGEKVGLIKVRLYRPFSVSHLIQALPASVKTVAVLDRTKEPGATGEPLYVDVVSALWEGDRRDVTAIGGRYGLSSKDFTPAMVKAVLDEAAKPKPKNHFTVGIVDDVTHTSLDVDPEFSTEPDNVVRALFYGLGADGTVGANKNSIKIIGEETDNWAQGYFVYDSKKSGAMTISHLRFGPDPIRSTYLLGKASFVGCHQWVFLNKYEMLDKAEPGAVFLLNSPYGPDEVWDHLPQEVQEQIIAKKLKFYVIDAYQVAGETGMGNRINSIMQTCFFAISGVLPREEAIRKIKEAIQKTYGIKGDEVVRRNFAAVDATLANLHEVTVPETVTSDRRRAPIMSPEAPDFIQRVTAIMASGHGDQLPVSAFPVDGTWPSGTTKWEKRNVAQEIPIWESDICIQCNKCSLVCPHAAIRAKVIEPDRLAGAPAAFRSTDFKAKDFRGMKFTIQVAPEDCTGCTVCVNVCPAKDKANPKRKAINMQPHLETAARERENYKFFLDLPDVDRAAIAKIDVKNSQFYQPLFEYSGACAGCGETPYIKLMTQLFGDRTVIANATGCSSIYGGNLPTTPYTTNDDGRGPAWSNSLFEDNGEFGFGFRLGIDQHRSQALELLQGLASEVGDTLVAAIVNADQSDEMGIMAQRERVQEMRAALESSTRPEARRLLQLADYLVKKSVWIVGGDGWAYDIGYGGLDHVFAQTRDVNVLVLDTEVYSNTGGQASKATPIGAAAKFASSGKALGKKDLGLMAMSYRHVYVASVAIGAKDSQTVRAFLEAESYPGPSLIIAYSHCIAHGYDLARGMDQQKLAVDAGVWPLFRYDPRRIVQGEPPLKLDSGPAKTRVSDYTRNETRFRMVERIDPERFKMLAKAAQENTAKRLAVYRQLAEMTIPTDGNGFDTEK